MFLWPLSSISTEFLSNEVASVNTIWLRVMNLVATELIYLMLQLVHYPIPYILFFLLLYIKFVIVILTFL